MKMETMFDTKSKCLICKREAGERKIYFIPATVEIRFLFGLNKI